MEDLERFLTVIICLVMLMVVIHEAGHIWDLKRQGVEIKEICLLGWRDNVTLGMDGVAWVEPASSNFDRSFHDWWDLSLHK